MAGAGLVSRLGAGDGGTHDALVIVTLGLHQGGIMTTGHTRGTFCFRSTVAATRAHTCLLHNNIQLTIHILNSLHSPVSGPGFLLQF